MPKYDEIPGPLTACSGAFDVFSPWIYGHNVMCITKSDDWDGPSYQTCADAGWVFKKLQFSRRHENLSWSHHREVAGLDEEDADRFLNDAITLKWSRKELRKQVSDFNGKNIKS